MTNFESWKQRIRLYFKGKDHGEYILQFINEGPFKMAPCRDEIASAIDAPYLGPGRDRVVSDLSQPKKDRLRADIRDNVKMLLEGPELTKDDHESQLYDEFEHFGQHKDENVMFTKLIHDTRYIKMTMPKIQLNSKIGPVQDIAQNEDNIFQADQCDAFDSDVDEAPTAQTMFMANLSFDVLVYAEVGLSFDSDTLSEDNKALVVQSDASSVPNDTVMMVTNDIYEQDAPCVTSNQPNNTVNASLIAELARYKELAEVYEKRAQFKLTKQELMIDIQMRMIIKDRNLKEESLQKELHSVKMQLNSTINHNKLIREEVSTLKQDFKQKENKLLEEFLDMKHLKEKVEDKLYKQDQSLQTVYTLCKPRNNTEVHLDYLKDLKESVATLREIVEEARVAKPLDCSIASAYVYTKHSQELLEYVIGTCSKDFDSRDKKIASTPLTRKK
uniref:Gag-Pol polyprotein n=1 Tax=Tanacetum cinerariifolium TaxID=118510 RepID=A0A6L2N479_TANCI|nr:Gag-Pol polyprotein [Tanacetum cinerariifolium]